MDDESTVGISLPELYERIGGFEAELKAVHVDVADVKKVVDQLSDKIPKPLTGEIVIAGQTWSKFQLAIIATVVALFGLLATDLRMRVNHLEAFAREGGRATQEELTALATANSAKFTAMEARLEIVRRCVALRFKERSDGIRDGADLRAPDRTLTEWVRNCHEDLEGLGK